MTSSPNISLILLAAGLSQRFGDANKLLADIDGDTVVAKSAAAFNTPDFSQRFAVVADKPVADALNDRWTIVQNNAPETGMANSLRLGLEAAGDCDWVVVALGDMPNILPDTVDLLFGAAAGEGSNTALPIAPMMLTTNSAPRPGHPVFWPRHLIPDLLEIEGDKGGKALLGKGFQPVICDDTGIYFDIDTPEDLTR